MFQTGDDDDVDAQVAAMMAELAVDNGGASAQTTAAAAATAEHAGTAGEAAMAALPAVPTDPPAAARIDEASLPAVFSALLDRSVMAGDAVAVPVPVPRSTSSAPPPPRTGSKGSTHTEFTFNL